MLKKKKLSLVIIVIVLISVSIIWIEHTLFEGVYSVKLGCGDHTYSTVQSACYCQCVEDSLWAWQYKDCVESKMCGKINLK